MEAAETLTMNFCSSKVFSDIFALALVCVCICVCLWISSRIIQSRWLAFGKVFVQEMPTKCRRAPLKVCNKMLRIRLVAAAAAAVELGHIDTQLG